MTFYLDTSLLVAALTAEAATERTQTWLAERDPGTLTLSEWVATEFYAALSIKLRTGQMNAVNRADALARFACFARRPSGFSRSHARTFASLLDSRTSPHWVCAPAMPCISRFVPSMAQPYARSTVASARRDRRWACKRWRCRIS